MKRSPGTCMSGTPRVGVRRGCEAAGCSGVFPLFSVPSLLLTKENQCYREPGFSGPSLSFCCYFSSPSRTRKDAHVGTSQFSSF